MGDVLVWLALVACLRGWHLSIGGMGGVLAWVTWVACLRLMFQIDLKSDLKEEPDLKAGVLTSYATILNMYKSQCGQICLDICNFLNMPEYS